jgi:hypothetical protein
MQRSSCLARVARKWIYPEQPRKARGISVDPPPGLLGNSPSIESCSSVTWEIQTVSQLSHSVTAQIIKMLPEKCPLDKPVNRETSHTDRYRRL